LKDLLRRDDDAENNDDRDRETPLPPNFEMDVYCISSNDYLKIEGIKPSSDGPPSCFSRASDTQVPSLRLFVHQTTADSRLEFTNAFVERSNNMLERLKLLAAGSTNIPGGRSSRRCFTIFENKMDKLESGIAPLAEDFRRRAIFKVQTCLSPSLQVGAGKARSTAIDVVNSWGSSNRRTRHERSADKNGLHCKFPEQQDIRQSTPISHSFSVVSSDMTYQATTRRGGEYVSGSAGEVNFNEELVSPMEKEFSSDWQRIMDSTLSRLLAEAESKIMRLCANLHKSLASSFAQTKMDTRRLQALTTTASRTCSNSAKEAFRNMKAFSVDQQRELNRSLLPRVKARMEPGYNAAMVRSMLAYNAFTIPFSHCLPSCTYAATLLLCLLQNVQRGSGTFSRMKHAMHSHTSQAVSSMFGESTKELSSSIDTLIGSVRSMVAGVLEVVRKALESVYSVCWDDQTDKSAAIATDPEHQQKVKECRDKLLPNLNELRKIQDAAMDLLGLEREEMELDLVAVDIWDQRIEKKMKAAKANGSFIEILDSDPDDDDDGGQPNRNSSTATSSYAAAGSMVKSEYYM